MGNTCVNNLANLNPNSSDIVFNGPSINFSESSFYHGPSFSSEKCFIVGQIFGNAYARTPIPLDI